MPGNPNDMNDILKILYGLSHQEEINEVSDGVGPPRPLTRSRKIDGLNAAGTVQGLHENKFLALGKMAPMLPPMQVLIGKGKQSWPARTKISIGKYSYPAALHVELFRFAIKEIRRYFKGPIALCKEVEEAWNAVGLDPKHCRSVCQYDEPRLFCSQ